MNNIAHMYSGKKEHITQRKIKKKIRMLTNCIALQNNWQCIVNKPKFTTNKNNKVSMLR
jgi:hypothetical protein